MTNADSVQFDDPILKAAVRRAWGQETAPTHLRARISAMLAESADTDTSDVEMSEPAPMRLVGAAREGGWRLPAWMGYAAAAVVVLAVGLVGVEMMNEDAPPPGVTLAGGLPASFIGDLVKTHDRCCDYANHHTIDAPRDDIHAIREDLEDRLGRPVWVFDATADGWQFRGAAVCRVAQQTSAHLLYDRPSNRQTLSVISVPFNGTCSLRAGEVVALPMQANHPVAGFLDAGEFHCLVGHSPDGSLTIDELRRMTERYRSNLQVARIADPGVLVAGRR